jgi:hypothetical protein
MWGISEEIPTAAEEDHPCKHRPRSPPGAQERARDMENVGFGIFVGALSLVGMAILVFAISGPMAVS